MHDCQEGALCCCKECSLQNNVEVWDVCTDNRKGRTFTAGAFQFQYFTVPKMLRLLLGKESAGIDTLHRLMAGVCLDNMLHGMKHYK